MVSKVSSNSSGYSRFRSYTARIFGYDGILGLHCKPLVIKSFGQFIAISSLLFVILALSCGYSYFTQGAELVILRKHEVLNATNLNSTCNLYDGNWVYDENYSSSYNASECPFVERGFNCFANGRKDREYLKWRWKPKNCDVPRLNVGMILENLCGKRVVFVGDSLSRTQWESMICMLMNGVEDKKSVHEFNGKAITKQIRYLGVRFGSFNFTVEFYRSVFLVQPGLVPKRAPKRVKTTLKLDRLDDISSEWVDSDLLVFNTGHWWTPGKLFDMGCYFRIGGKMKLGMSMNTAYETALTTWGSWVESKVNTNRTLVFFRTFEPSHWSEGSRKICKVPKHPLSNSGGRERSPFSDIIMKVVKNMSVPVSVMHVTPMGAFRSDAHVGQWGDNPLVPDCSHWCLPGVPDTWNDILFSSLLSPKSGFASTMLTNCKQILSITFLVLVFYTFDSA